MRQLSVRPRGWQTHGPTLGYRQNPVFEMGGKKPGWGGFSARPCSHWGAAFQHTPPGFQKSGPSQALSKTLGAANRSWTSPSRFDRPWARSLSKTSFGGPREPNHSLSFSGVFLSWFAPPTLFKGCGFLQWFSFHFFSMVNGTWPPLTKRSARANSVLAPPAPVLRARGTGRGPG